MNYLKNFQMDYHYVNFFSNFTFSNFFLRVEREQFLTKLLTFKP